MPYRTRGRAVSFSSGNGDARFPTLLVIVFWRSYGEQISGQGQGVVDRSFGEDCVLWKYLGRDGSTASGICFVGLGDVQVIIHGESSFTQVIRTLLYSLLLHFAFCNEKNIVKKENERKELYS